MKELDFGSILPQELSVRISGEQYTLREPMGDAICRWRNAVLKCTQIDGDGKPRALAGLADTEPLLISLCLYAGEKLVPLPTIRAWPNRVQKKLFEEAKRMAGLDDPDTADGLRERIDELQQKLDALAGNSQGA